MAFEAEVVRVMLSSPSDVAEARAVAEHAINRWNETNSENLKVVFLPWLWEVGAVPDLSESAQSVINREGVDRSDLVIAFFRSRIGSQSPKAISGTIEEIERARTQGKSVHLFFSSEPHPSGVDPAQLVQLREFQEEVRTIGLVGEYASLDEFRQSIERVLFASAYNTHPDTHAEYFNRGQPDRVYEEISIEWMYSRAAVSADLWDARFVHRRIFVTKGPRSVSKFTISLNKDGDRSSPQFGSNGSPKVQLASDSSRSDGGLIELRPARKSAGTSFAQDIEFSPPLTPGTHVFLSYEGEFPGYKFANRDEIQSNSADTKLGLRDWDSNSFVVNYPTSVFNYSIFLPDDLEATPLGPQVDRDGQVDSALTNEILADSYTQQRVRRGDEDGWLMALTVREPIVKYSYRLKWRTKARSSTS